jgi:hypothetical protein
MEEAEANADRVMDQVQWYRFALGEREYSNILAVDGYFGPSKMLESSNDGNAAGVDKTAVVIQYMNIGTDRPALCTCNDAERLGINRARASDCLFEDPG